MRKIFVLMTVILLLLININTDFTTPLEAAVSEYKISYFSNVYEPVNPKCDLTVSGSVAILSGPSNDYLRLRYELYSPLKNGMNQYYEAGYATKRFKYPATKNPLYSFRIIDVDNIARKGITIKFGLYDTNRKIYLNTVEGHLENKSSVDIDIDTIGGELVFEPCLYLSRDKIYEKFSFPNYSHIVEINEYYRFDLSPFAFKYTYNSPFECDELYLSFIDPDNLFPYINSGGPMKTIPLKATQNKNNISLAFIDLYVKPDTLEMSLTNREEFVKTKYFYFPINKMKRLQGHTFYINMRGGGVSNINYSYPYEVYFQKLLLGPCNQSSYCIVGGMTE